MAAGSAGGGWVFGYGSLAAGDGVRCVLRGFERRWGVAMDNAIDLPGYKFFIDARTGERPAAYVAFVDVRARLEARVEGVALAVDAAGLAALDDRERNYARVELGGRLDARLGGPVWCYAGRPDARARFERGRRAGRLVVTRAYLEAVGAAVPDLAPPPCPVCDLRVVGLP